MLSFAAICPHPPLLIPAIGGDDTCRVRSTLDAMTRLGKAAAEEKIDTFLIVSPHGPVRMDRMSVNLAENLLGDFSDFGNDDLKMRFANDLELSRGILELAQARDFPLQSACEFLDHGAMVPLYFLTKQLPAAKVCHLGFSYLDYTQHFAFGRILAAAGERTERRVALIASGDLSHRLTASAPAGYAPEGRFFDEELLRHLEENETPAILEMDDALIENAGECGLRSIIILLGALSDRSYRFEKMSYEGPFGVGYLTGRFIF